MVVRERCEEAKESTWTESDEQEREQFHILLSTEDAKNGKDIKHLVQVLSKRLSLSEAKWQTGH